MGERVDSVVSACERDAPFGGHRQSRGGDGSGRSSSRGRGACARNERNSRSRRSPTHSVKGLAVAWTAA